MTSTLHALWFNVLTTLALYAFQGRLIAGYWRDPGLRWSMRIEMTAVAVGLVCVPVTVLAVMRVEMP